MNLGIENEYVEFKKSISELDKGVRSITAMLNRHNRGKLYIGVNDSGEVIGIQSGKSTLMDIKQNIRNNVKPNILTEVKLIVSDDNKEYIEVDAIGNDIPYSFDGRFYIRNGASDEQVDNSMLRRMLISNKEDIIVEKESNIQNLTFKYLKGLMQERNIHVNSDEDIYNNYHFLSSTGKFNYTAYLLSDQNAETIKIIRFDGVDKSSMHDIKEYKNQSILKTLKEVVEYIKNYNSNSVDLSSAERKETMLFDEDAMREAVINAFVHNDWKYGWPPSFFIYDDRIEISSYGQIPYKLTMDDFYSGRSVPVNQALFNIFMITGMSEQSGHGVPAVVKHYGRGAYEIWEGGILVTLKFGFEKSTVFSNKNKSHNVEKDEKNDDFNIKRKRKIEEIIYDLIKGDNQISMNEIAQKIGISKETVKYQINKLKEEDVIKHQGQSRNGDWEVMIDDYDFSSDKKRFEQFYYTFDEKLHDLLEVQDEYEKKNGDISKYKGKMLCPECKKAELKFTHETEKKKAFLSKNPSASHSDTCSYIHEYAPRKVFEEYIQDLSKEQIDGRLESALNLLLNKRIDKKEPSIAKNDNENPFIIPDINSNLKKQKYYCMPRKSLNVWIDKKDNGKCYIFYGRVKLKSVETSKKGIYNLYILTKQNDEWKYKLRVYRGNIKDEFEENEVYDVALYGKLEYKDNISCQIKILNPDGIKVRVIIDN